MCIGQFMHPNENHSSKPWMFHNYSDNSIIFQTILEMSGRPMDTSYNNLIVSFIFHRKWCLSTRPPTFLLTNMHRNDFFISLHKNNNMSMKCVILFIIFKYQITIFKPPRAGLVVSLAPAKNGLYALSESIKCHL